jgi:hypothetical protein
VSAFFAYCKEALDDFHGPASRLQRVRRGVYKLADGPMRRVIVESPYRGKDRAETERNRRYARACLRDCLVRGESPLASHLLYTQAGVLDDADEEERNLGIEAGLAWGVVAEASVVYEDLGISPGMARGIEQALGDGRPVEYRRLPPLALRLGLLSGR